MYTRGLDRMMKRAGRAVIPIGLPAPTTAMPVTKEDAYTTMIAAFDGSDGTQASSWFGNAGQDQSKDEDGNRRL
jgi:hypothetical protein